VHLRLARWQHALPLQLAPVARPPLRARRRRLLRVEARLQVLRVGRHEGGHALEAVRRECATEAHAPIEGSAGAAVGVPPHEALRPQVRLLDGAEAVRRLCIDAVTADAGVTAIGGWLVVEGGLADLPSAPERLRRR
jgi:hypothetical protein